MKKRTLGILMTLIMVIGLMPVTAMAESLPAWATTAGWTTDDVIWDAETKTLTLLKDVKLTKTAVIRESITITSADKSNPCKITTDTNEHGYLLQVAGSFAEDEETYTPAEVVLENIIVDGGSKSDITATRALVAVGDNSNLSFKAGYLTLGEGVIICNNDNTTEEGAGGGVCVIAGGLEIDGGEISGNTAYQGGGVAIVNLESNYVELKDGFISGNKSTKNGGGIYQATGTVTVDGGKIEENEAENYGGGVYISTPASTFKLQTGVISDNKASYGGGIFSNENKSITLSGGTVTKNIAENWGAGMLIAPSGVVAVLGDINISGNTNTSGEAGADMYIDGYEYEGIHLPTVTIGEFSDKAIVNTYSWLKPAEGGELLMITAKDDYTIPASAKKYVTYEDENYTYRLKDNKLYLIEKPEVVSVEINSTDHKTEYTTGSGLDVTNLTIKVKTEDDFEETVEVTEEMVSGFDSSTVGIKTLTITYEGKTANYEVIVTEPVSADGNKSSSKKTKKYDSIIKQAENGDVKVDDDYAKRGQKITITVMPDAGYELDELTIIDQYGDEVDYEKGKKENTYVFEMPKGDVEIEASFKKIDEEEPAADEEEITLILTIGQVIYQLNGEYLVNDVAPVIKEERTMLPIRLVAETLGAAVTWNETEQAVTIAKDDLEIVIYIGQPFATVNGNPVELDAPAFIESNRTFLPIRFIAENLGAEVIWDGTAQTVTITFNR